LLEEIFQAFKDLLCCDWFWFRTLSACFYCAFFLLYISFCRIWTFVRRNLSSIQRFVMLWLILISNTFRLLLLCIFSSYVALIK